MKNAATQELFSYWNRLRGARMAPDRADIDPSAIRGVLADTFLLDTTAPDHMPFRISGARVNALFANELKGFDFLSIWETASRRAIQDLVLSVAGDPSPAIAGVKAAPAGHPAIDLELLLLPLRHFGRTQARILGCLSPSTIPLWLGLAPVDGLALGPMRILRLASPEGDDFGARRPRREESPHRHGHLRVHLGGNSSQNDVASGTR